VAIVQARMTSTRLPGKVLHKVLGKPMLSIQLERIRQVSQIGMVVVATTDNAADDAIEKVAGMENVAIFRGSENDVLSRFHEAANVFDADVIVRLTGDCPLIDPDIIAHVIKTFLDSRNGCHFVTNAIPRSYPAGLDVECFSKSALETANAEATECYDREHVTPYFYKHPYRFKARSVICDKDLSKERWTLDEPSDFELIKKIIEGLYEQNPKFRMYDILSFLNAHPDLRALNSMVRETPRVISASIFGED
jgi:spore coat polysaccharide biosynthesis protein SpsF